MVNTLINENTLENLLSKLSKTFSENPLFNIFYRWFLICSTPTILGYSVCQFIFKQENLAKFIFFITPIIFSCFFIHSVIHLPKKKKNCFYIMLYSNSNDYTLVTNGISAKCISLCKNKPYGVICPNKSCRYFYNWIKAKHETSNSKFFEFFNTHLENSTSAFLFGVINDEESHNNKVSKIIPNICINTNSSSITNTTSLIEDTSFIINNNDSCNEVDLFSRMLVSYADYIFSINDNEPQIKKLNTILDIYEHAQNISSVFPQNRCKTMLENMTTQITSEPVDNTQIDEYIIFCKRFLKHFPDNVKILLDLQYFTIEAIKDKSISSTIIKQTAEELLEIGNISLSTNDSDREIFELNRAYLSLLAGNFDYAIDIYRTRSILPPKIFEFFIETMDSPTLGIYSKYAFVINYYYKTSSPNHKKALVLAQSLMQNCESIPNTELHKSLKKFIKPKKFIKKK